jgi:hypothetical protein
MGSFSVFFFVDIYHIFSAPSYKHYALFSASTYRDLLTQMIDLTGFLELFPRMRFDPIEAKRERRRPAPAAGPRLVGQL